MTLPLNDGLLVVVKEDCDTCRLVVPVFDEIPGLVIVSQDDPSFPRADVVDDSDLDISWHLQTETTPTIYRIESGEVVASEPGWHRGRWETLTGVDGLGEGLPDRRPGCGSLVFDLTVRQTLLRRHSPSRIVSRRVEIEEAEDVVEAMYARGWSDGLPLVPPTEARVERMLGGTELDPDEVLVTMPPDLVPCTVEKVAVNAVMAGCLPAYLPVVIAAVRAAATDRFNIHGVAATTYFSGPIVIVNGPIATRIGMNSGMNALGQGNRANATIGRALNLVIRNVGGAVPGGVDRSTLGSPGKLTFCFAEDESGSPWDSLADERGFESGASTVTLFAGHGPTEVWDQSSRTADSLANSFAGQLVRVGHLKLARSFDAVVVISPEHARIFTGDGWDKRRLRQELTERLTRPGEDLVLGAGGTAEGIPAASAEGMIPKFRRGGLWFVHAGGQAGLFSAILPGWANGPRGSEITTVEI